MPKSKKPDVPPAQLRNPRVIIFGEIVVDEGSRCVYEPWLNKKANVFGWSARKQEFTEGQRVFIYVAPIITNEDGEEPQFFLFVGPYGDPDRDRRLGPYTLMGGQP